jgi:hypothetical protein
MKFCTRPLVGASWLRGRLGWLIIFLVLFGWTGAQATVLIYRVDYERTGQSVNYPSPRFGYFFVDPNSGAVSTLTVLIDPFSRNLYYTTGLLSGQFFQVRRLHGSSTNDVITASSGAGGGESASLQVTGQTNKRFSVGGGQRFRLSSKLTGTLMLSGQEQPAEVPALTREAIAAELGFVGFAEATARYQRSASRLFNNRGEGVAEATEFYREMLEAMGIKAEREPQPDPSPTPIPVPVPSPSPEDDPFPDPTPDPIP